MRSTPHLVFRAGDAAPVVRGWATPDTPDSARHQRPLPPAEPQAVGSGAVRGSGTERSTEMSGLSAHERGLLDQLQSHLRDEDSEWAGQFIDFAYRPAPTGMTLWTCALVATAAFTGVSLILGDPAAVMAFGVLSLVLALARRLSAARPCAGRQC